MFNIKNNLVYFTKDLINREDFATTRRFKFYKNGSGKNIFLEVLNINGTFLNIPIVDRETISNSKEIESFVKSLYQKINKKFQEPPVADSEIKKDNIYFSLLGLETNPVLFDHILEKNIPFTLVCPKGTKCEWFDLGNRECENGSGCVGCLQCSLDTEDYCKQHNDIYKKGSNADKENKNIHDVIENFRMKILDSVVDGCSIRDYKDEFVNYTGKIPVFQYSSAIDILRWHNFKKGLERFHEFLDSRNKAKAKNIGMGLSYLGKKNE